ncbi:MAG: pyridoxamine 5'-phosphate oxidase family protein [Xanthobacteraceae bacterium]|nr:pyridoxamine 5'-phosphate oxidase family protein [Xanthobacteraceae bacterium]
MPAKSDPAEIARDLLRGGRQGALATLMTGTGDPYCSLVNVAPDSDGAPILLISALALHTKNLVSDPRVSLMLDERREGDPLEGARIMLAGRAERATDRDVARLRRRYLAFHPSAEGFAGFADFSFFRIAPSGLHLVAGFGRIVDLPPERFLIDLTGADALIAAEPEIVAHMNDDHRDTMNLYATRLLGGPSADWHCAGCDPQGLDLLAGHRWLRLVFPHRVENPAALRATLKDLAVKARARG